MRRARILSLEPCSDVRSIDKVGVSAERDVEEGYAGDQCISTWLKRDVVELLLDVKQDGTGIVLASSIRGLGTVLTHV